MGFRASQECRQERGELGFRHLAGGHRELFVADLAEAGDIAVDPYVKGAVSYNQIGALPIEQPRVICIDASVPTEQAVRAKDPKIALSRNRRRNNRWKMVFRTRTDRLFLGRLVHDDIDLAQRKTGDLDIVELQVVKTLIFDRKNVAVPIWTIRRSGCRQF